MKSDTRRRIQIYEGRLPHIREKLSAAALGLVVAALVAVSASFAWVTLSRSPEVANIATTISANGSLEIALSNPEGTAPSDADIDESVTKSVNVVSSNLQWGNLVNLNDASYGIDNLELRPAQLNTGSLLRSPLWGAEYGEDGRVTQLNSKYTYVSWDTSEGKFTASSNLGVRAIASYTTEKSDAASADYDAKLQELLNAHTAVNEFYKNSVMSKSNISALGEVLQTYLQSEINSQPNYAAGDANLPLTSDQLQTLLNIYDDLYTAMEKEADLLVMLANLQQYNYAKTNGTPDTSIPYTDVTWDTMKAKKATYDTKGGQHKTNPTTPEEAISITGLSTFITDMNTASSDVTLLQGLVAEANAGKTVISSRINGVVENLCSIKQMELGDNRVKVSEILGDITGNINNLLNMAISDVLVWLCDGVLYRFESMAIDGGYQLEKSKKADSDNKVTFSVSAKVVGFVMTVNVNGHFCTNADETSNFLDDYNSLPEFSASVKTAEDTYGMAIDFWIRTNAEETVLTLEGAVTADAEGNVLKYDGVNRVWGAAGNAALPTTGSTTQGGGSCYIYYADTPEDQSRSLKLLGAMKIAFVSQDGQLLATGSMDTENFWAENGRVTVPLVVDESSGVAYTYKDATNEELTARGITTLLMDRAQRITAIIYLDGTRLENTDVLAAAEIEGQLNLQFGSSVSLNTVGDNDLLLASRTVTATAAPTELNFNDGNSKPETTVTVEVNGTQPDEITAFFVRAINSTQGSRQDEMRFTKGSDGKWTAKYEFKAPGTYYLRYVRLDGVDHALEVPVQVTVKGFAITSVAWDQGGSEKTVYSPDSTYSVKLTAEVSTDGTNAMPSTVQARFMRDDGVAVNVDMTLGTDGKWTGTGKFSASGTYTLSYLLLDGNYYDVGNGNYKTLNLNLGLRVKVITASGVSLEDTIDTTATEQQVFDKRVLVTITNDIGTELTPGSAATDLTEAVAGTGIETATLTYSNGGSATNAVTIDLTWNGNEEYYGYYAGALPLVNPGRYMFYSLKYGDNYITRAEASPTFVIISPYPPEYVESTGNQYNNSSDKAIQYAPLQDTAYIGRLVIKNSASVTMSAVVYNDVTGEYYDITQGSGAGVSGTMDYISEGEDGYWRINLPQYTVGEGENTTHRIDGNWSLVCVKMGNCYVNGTSYSNENPLIWASTSAVAEQYLTENDLTAAERYNFSKLDTYVSSQVNVTMTPGTTALGGTDAEFMANNYVKDIGMSLSIKDDAGNNIPASTGMKATLQVSYGGNSAEKAAQYGYEVAASASMTYDIPFTQQADGTWAIDTDSNDNWQYVGEYTVASLTLAVNGKELTVAPNSNGVPAMYTVTSEAPTLEDVDVKVENGNTVLGKNGETVTGTFLQSYRPNTQLKLTLSKDTAGGHARIAGLSGTLTLTYQGGSAANGGYYWGSGESDTNPYKSLTFPLGATSSGNTYTMSVSGDNSAQTMLAGTYKVSYTLTSGSSTKNGNAANIAVYSAQPDVTITGVSKAGEQVLVSSTGAALVADKGNLFYGTNQFGSHYAVVYMEYAQGAENYTHSITDCSYAANTAPNRNLYANYTAPIVTLKLTDTSGYGGTAIIPNNETSTLTLNRNEEISVAIGTITKGSVQNGSHTYTYGSSKTCTITYTTETASVIGTQTIRSITTEVNGVTYTRDLATPVVISQSSQQSGSINWTNSAAATIEVKNKENAVYNDGMAVSALTELTVTVTANKGYYAPSLDQPDGAIDWKRVSSDETKAVYTFKMSAGDVSLGSPTANAYPTVTLPAFTQGTVTASVDGEAITSGTSVKTGSVVTVTVTANKGYYGPTASVGTNVTDLIRDESASNDSVAVYTFAMPNTAVTVSAGYTGQTYQLRWENTAALTFSAVDKANESTVIENGDYVIPGHSVVVTVAANGGQNPELTKPDKNTATRINGDISTAQYQFTMPGDNVTLEGKADPYPVLTFGNDYADVSVKSGNIPVTEKGDTAKGIMSGNTVELTLTAKAGYYTPSMSKPDGVENWMVVQQPDNSTAKYSFTMPEGEGGLNISSLIKAEVAPTVTFADTDKATISISGTNYDGSNISSASDAKVQPGQTVTVTVTAKSGYYNPTVTASGYTLSSRNVDTSDSAGWNTATYTFTMGTSNVTLTASATADPTVTVNLAGASAEIKAGKNAVSGTVHPGETVTVTVTADATHYAPHLDKPSNVGDSWAMTTENDTGAVYSFIMPADAVSLNGTIGAKRQISWSAGNYATLIVTSDGNSVRSGAYVKPGAQIEYKMSKATGYANHLVAVSPSSVRVSNQRFTMPDSNVELTVTAKPTLIWSKLDDFSSGTATVTYTVDGTTTSVPINTETVVPAGATVTATVPGYKVSGSGCESDTYYGGYIEQPDNVEWDNNANIVQKPSQDDLTGIYQFLMPDAGVSFGVGQTDDESVGCITEDTLITLTDGTQKRVDELTGTETLLTWNHLTGSYDTAPVAYLIDHGGERTEHDIIHLYFSDGSDLEIVGEHVFYNADSGKYITLDATAADYIGTGFAKLNADSGKMDVVQLTDVKMETKVTAVYEVVTDTYMTCFTDGILTASAYIDKLLNIFDINTETMAYEPLKMISDICTYGLYTYDDLSDICTEEQFNMHNGALLKIAVGKGTLTDEDLLQLSYMLNEFANENAAAGKQTSGSFKNLWR